MNHIEKIRTDGISYMEILPGSQWYWGSDYTGGDLFEAYDLYRCGYSVEKDRLIFVHRETREVWEPVPAEKGRYFGRPAFIDGKIVILHVHFPDQKIVLESCDEITKEKETLAELPLSCVSDCYNLMPSVSPVCITRQAFDNHFQIVWPEQTVFEIAPAESFCFRDGDLLYFSHWYEDPDYREEVVVRRVSDGTILEQYPGSIQIMPEGQRWILN